LDDRPRDNDVITAADKLLGWAYGDMSKLSDDQIRTVADILRIAAPEGSVGEMD
jgi:hypothetical protein